MPKEAFYKKLNLSTGLKDKFVTDIKKIIWQNKLSPTTLNIEKGESVTEILVLMIELKKKDLDYKIIETIAKQNPHKILFILKYENSTQLALWFNKLYKNDWVELEHLSIEIKGLNLEEIWDNFVEQIALLPMCRERFQSVPIGVAERLVKQEEIIKLQNEIEKIERQARTEKQPKKKFEMVQEMQSLKMKLEGLDWKS
jgi:hypothetical protein